MSHSKETIRRPRRRLAGVVVALVGVAVVVGGYWLLTQGPGRELVSPPGSTVAEFRGTGDQTTDTFQVREGWQIQWGNSGPRFAFAITGDRDFGTVIDQHEPGSGVTSPVGGGAFQLVISAEGSWTIVVVQGE
jgi:hypothetical protein